MKDTLFGLPSVLIQQDPFVVGHCVCGSLLHRLDRSLRNAVDVASFSAAVFVLQHILSYDIVCCLKV